MNFRSGGDAGWVRLVVVLGVGLAAVPTGAVEPATPAPPPLAADPQAARLTEAEVAFLMLVPEGQARPADVAILERFAREEQGSDAQLRARYALAAARGWHDLLKAGAVQAAPETAGRAASLLRLAESLAPDQESTIEVLRMLAVVLRAGHDGPIDEQGARAALDRAANLVNVLQAQDKLRLPSEAAYRSVIAREQWTGPGAAGREQEAARAMGAVLASEAAQQALSSEERAQTTSDRARLYVQVGNFAQAAAELEPIVLDALATSNVSRWGFDADLANYTYALVRSGRDHESINLQLQALWNDDRLSGHAMSADVGIAWLKLARNFEEEVTTARALATDVVRREGAWRQSFRRRNGESAVDALASQLWSALLREQPELAWRMRDVQKRWSRPEDRARLEEIDARGGR